MRLFNKIVYSISLLPIIIIIFVSSLNLKDKLSLKILVWKTPEISLGTFLFAGTCLGYISSYFLLSGLVMSNNRFKTKRIFKNESKVQTSYYDNSINESEKQIQEDQISDYNSDIYMERDLRDPVPTLSIPFKVIRKNKTSSLNQEIKNKKVKNNPSNFSSSEYSEEINDPLDNEGWNKLNLENW
tara:strand:+ start:1087 stop:1641 length:555 start_codon:yes stop_codon:yes gene_type:complete